MRELKSDFDRSYNPFLSLKNPRKGDPQILFTAHSSVWQLLLPGISPIFQLYPSFSFFDLILLDPTSGKIIPLFLRYLFGK